jgi:hypothetical protein
LAVLLTVTALFAASCADDDDDAATTAATAASPTTGEDAGTTPIDSATTAAETAATGEVTGNADPQVGQARDAADFLARLAQLYPETLKYADPVEQADGATTRGVTDTTITIGSVTGMTSPQGFEPFVGMCEGTMARIELENSKGGVQAQDGKTRTFEFAGQADDKGRVCQDDTLDRDLNRQKILDMVDGEEVFALLPLTSNGFFAGDYLNDQHVPYFGFGFQPDYCGPDKPFAFAVGGAVSCDVLGSHTFVTTTTSAPLFEATGEDPAAARVALAGDASPATTTGNRVVKLSFETTGAEVVTIDNSLPPPGSPLPTDYSPFVSALLRDDPTVISLVLSFDVVEPMAKALRDAGYDGVIQQFVYEDERLALVPQSYPGIDESYVGAPGVGAPVGATDGLSDIRAALDAIGFEAVPMTTNVLYGWGAADMLIRMIQEAPGPLTTESITNYANRGWGYEGYGEAVCPSSWPLQHYQGSPCIHIVELDLTGDDGATNGIGANGGQGGLLPKVTLMFNDLFIVEKPS